MEGICSSETSVHIIYTHCHIPQKTAFFIVTAVKTSNPTICRLLCLAYCKEADKTTEHVTIVTGHFKHMLTTNNKRRKDEI
jgi:hypothetical protein